MSKPVKLYRLSIKVRRIILDYADQEYSHLTIQKRLQNDHGIQTTREAVRLFLNRFKRTGEIRDIRKPRYNSRVKKVHKQLIDMWISEDSEMSPTCISDKLFTLCGLTVSADYISRLRTRLGFKTCRTKYCQLITIINRAKRLQWCLNALSIKENFLNVIFTDETTVEMSANSRIFYHKTTSDFQKLPAKKQKPKHGLKVHVWAGISSRGRTSVCVFTGIMDSVTYQKILQDNLLPFVRQQFPDGYRLYQDNDSKHVSKSTKKWMEENGVLDNAMTTPASSPDIKPIENLWSELKDFLQTKVKPKKKDELVAGIKQFWETVTQKKCLHYISHVHKVIPVVILNDGAPSGY